MKDYETTQALHLTFADPPREFGVMPFWFWNDDLCEEELVRQVREFHRKGFGGFIPHARIGLSRRVGYLTDEYFRLLRLAVEEADRLGMKVVLYDEGSYPSGSAQGRVVAENPAFASRCLIPLYRKIDGPSCGYWRPNPGRAMQDRLVCVVLGQEVAPDVLDPASLMILQPEEGPGGLFRYDLPEGQWRLVACWEVFSGGTIRGVFDEEDDNHPLAPPAGDIMNSEAVASFIRHTHEQYYTHLRDWFGTTIVAMFTDEPNPLGRSPRRGPHPKPFTAGLLDDLGDHWDSEVQLWLPALWLDCGRRTEEFRQAYDRVVHDRIERVFYAAQSNWCDEHGIALTGHPERSNEMGALRHFHWPGQDTVWQLVRPGSTSRLEGPHSVAPKAASSVAALFGCRKNASEALGAYGWRLTLDEAKWLVDWHLAKGNNLFFLHACFYSIRGRRAFESEPDLGIHNVWWPHFGVIADYVRRVCWLLTDGSLACDVAILTDPNNMAWSVARVLTQEQIDFVYVDDVALSHAYVERNRLIIGQQRFRVVVCDPPNIRLSSLCRALLSELRVAGGVVIEEWRPDKGEWRAQSSTSGVPDPQPEEEEEPLVSMITAAAGRDLDWANAPDLRALHYRKAGRDFYFVVNEGEDSLQGELSVSSVGALELWDPLDGSVRPWPARNVHGRTHTTLRLERRQGMVLMIDPNGAPDPDVALPPLPGDVISEISEPWMAMDLSGAPVTVPCPGDWAQVRGWEMFSGTLRFVTQFELSDLRTGSALFLDLGRVGDIAEVLLNGRSVAERAWAPYIMEVGQACHTGVNTIEVRVTNSMANTYDGLQMPSGLTGPVTIRSCR